MPRLVFEKTGDSVWISHLDLMRVFQRAFRRAGVLLKHSQGFTPRAIVSIALPLSVGMESVCELLDYELENDRTVTAKQLNAVLPAGIRVLSVGPDDRKIKYLTHLNATVTMTYDGGVPADAQAAIAELFSRETVELEKHSRKGKTVTNIIPLLKSLSITQPDKKTLVLDVVVCAQNPSLNPQMLVTAMETYTPDYAPSHSVVRRLEVYDGEGNVFR